MQLELGVDELLEDAEENLLGLVKKVTGTGNDAVTAYYDTDAAAPYVGVGYIRVRRKNGVKYQAVWYYKAQFSKNSENTTTKGESIEWQTPTVVGDCAGIDIDSSGKATFRTKRIFDTESAAKTWLNGLAGIT